MEEKIKALGKGLFWLSFVAGSTCLFGYILTRNMDFAFAGFLTLIVAGIVNAVVFVGLILFAVFFPKYAEVSFRAALTLLINIPVSILYFCIGEYLIQNL